MKITKYEHACLVLEEQGKKLVIDPGIFSESCTDFSNVVAVIITHVHPDHFDPEKLTEIKRHNPDVVIFTVQDVKEQLDNLLPVQVVTGNEDVACGPFKLEFFGELHAVIHPSYPSTQNVGIMVNDIFYYPGDSYTFPERHVKVLAVPSIAPWMKLGEAIDFITAVKAERAFPTHNALLSAIGANIYNPQLLKASQSVGTDYVLLESSQSLSI